MCYSMPITQIISNTQVKASELVKLYPLWHDWLIGIFERCNFVINAICSGSVTKDTGGGGGGGDQFKALYYSH